MTKWQRCKKKRNEDNIGEKSECVREQRRGTKQM